MRPPTFLTRTARRCRPTCKTSKQSLEEGRMQSIVIVGSGLAGYSVAREVRKRDKTARLVVVTADDGHFYSKPMLSEAFRLGSPVTALSSRSAEAMAAQFKGEEIGRAHV